MSPPSIWLENRIRINYDAVNLDARCVPRSFPVNAVARRRELEDIFATVFLGRQQGSK